MIVLTSKLSHLNLPTPPKQVSPTTFEINLSHLRLQDMIVPQSDSNLTKSCSVQTLGNNIFLSSKLSHLTLPTTPKQVSETTVEMNLPRLRLQDMIVPQSDTNMTKSCSIKTLGENIFLSLKLSDHNLPMPHLGRIVSFRFGTKGNNVDLPTQSSVVLSMSLSNNNKNRCMRVPLCTHLYTIS